jgi:hypothetical protein
MIQPSDRASLQKKPVHEAGASLTPIHHNLERDRSSQMTVFRSIDDAHSAASDRFQKPVVADQESVTITLADHFHLEASQ